MVTIAVTVCDCSHVAHAGGDPQRVTAVIELADSQVPEILRAHLEAVAQLKQAAKERNMPAYVYESVVFSLVDTSYKPKQLPKPCPGPACDGDCDDVSCDADK